MSPKKTVKNCTSKTKNVEKIAKRTVKREKPKLNMPANIKVSIPLTKSIEEGIHTPIIRGRGPPRFKKNLDFETKVELANSVARQQLLVKEEKPILQPDNIVFIKSQKRGRPKRVEVVSKFFKNCVLDSTDVTSTEIPKKNLHETMRKPTQRIVTRKRLADSTAQEVVKRPKMESRTDTEKLDAKVKSEDIAFTDGPEGPNSNPTQTQPTVVQPTSVVQPTPVVQPQPTVLQSEPTAKKSKSTIKRPQPVAKKQPTMKKPAARKKRAKGKQDSVVAGNNSSSILNRLRKLPKRDTEAEVKQNQPNTPGPVDSRKTSVSSNSNLSWTKDISSSSNTTCITACSNDFVRFNKKLPVLKLTNIDNELKKRQNSVQEIVPAADVDETDEDSSDSFDSDSSTDSERNISEPLRDSVDVNSLHLSVSTPSNFSQSRCKESSSTDYAKAAKKLSLTMEKLDMEIINWISSENTDVNANLATFRDKMFDILDNEFGVITHCRRLKEILEPPKVEDIIDETGICEQVQDHNVNKDTENANDDIENANNFIQNANNVIENANNNNEENADHDIENAINDKVNANDDIEHDNNDIDNDKTPVEKNTKETEFAKPLPRRKLSSTSEGNISNSSALATRDESSEGEMLTGNSFYDYHDDDDALSLFAESITGFESVRMNSSIGTVAVSSARAVEEYIPKPVKDDCVSNSDKHTYCPTKIREDESMTSKIKTICEKQNADSTSIYKQSNSTDDAESYQDFNENNDLDTRIGTPDVIKKPRLMDSYFEGLPKARSVVFGNLCFYNLMNCCRKVYFGQCRFLHVIPTSAQIKAKLNLLDERMLIQEYLLLRNWMELRRRYGMCYVEECAKRGLTRVLVEIAYDFIVKARNDSEEDTKLRVDTIEITLLHLNTVDLSICEDLLKLTIHADQGNKTLLCDVFMATMSITQNFSRFKIVFLTLTYFMVDIDRTFNKDVVEHILERVCILPFEEPIARALIQMMRLTKSDIFNNSMIGHFEKQISVNKDVFEEYSLLKNQCAFTSMLASSMMSASPPPTVDQPLSIRPDAGDGQPPAPSPDTTNLDKMNKTADEPPQPVITRTIGINPPIIFNRDPTSPGPSAAHENPSPTRAHIGPGPPRAHTSSGSSNSDDTVNLNIKKWRNRAIFPHSQFLLPPTPNRTLMRAPIRATMRPPMRPQMRPNQRMPFNQRLVTFRSPSNYVNRQPGPKY